MPADAPASHVVGRGGTAALPQMHDSDPSPQAQLVFCIDVRSERMRRHLEGRGRSETMGAAGFFGLPIAYRGADDVVSERSPALLRPPATVTERCDAPRGAQGTTTGLAHAVAAVERNPCLVLGWAEAAGWGLAPALACATSLPASTASFVRRVRERLATPRTRCSTW